MPKVSVIIPVHNAERYLGECLDSVLGQTLKDIEVVCVDDGSTDGSPGMLADCASRDGRLRIFRQKCSGAGIARNVGLRNAEGEYVLFCDADDWVDKCMLSRLYARAHETGSDIVVSGARYYDEELRADYRVVSVSKDICRLPQPFGPDALGKRIFTALRTQAWNKLFHRGFVVGLGLEFQDIPRVNDLAFVNTALACARHIVVEGGSYYHYRKSHGGNLSSRINEMPEMAALAWLRVKENLESRGVFGEFSAAFSLAASQALVNSLLAMTDASAAERFHGRIVGELIPALGLREEDAAEDAKPFFSGGGALEMFMRRLATERENMRRVREKLVECSAELSRIKGGRAWKIASFLQRLAGRGGN